MSLRMYGQYIIQATAPAEDPVMVGTLWYDATNAALKVCTSVAPYTFSSQSLLVAHNLLSATHPDTTPASPVRGDLIVAQGSTPLWARLSLGANHAVLRSDGTDAAWGAIVAGDLPATVVYTDQAEVITGAYTFSTDPVFNANAIPWAKISKLTSSLADLATRSASDLSSGTLPAGRFPALTGDLTTVAGALATTLATVNGNVGSFGSSTAIPVVTVNAKGLITAISTAVVVAPAGTLSGTTLNATVVASSLTSVGTLTGGATGAGFTVALSVSTITGTLTDGRLSTNVMLMDRVATVTAAFAFNNFVTFSGSPGNTSSTISPGLIAAGVLGDRLLGSAAGAANRFGYRVVSADSVAANAITIFDFDKNGILTTDLVTSARALIGTSVSSGAGATDIVIPNVASLRGVAASGSTTYSLISLDTSNVIRFGGDSGANDSASINFSLPQVTSFPSAASGNTGSTYINATAHRICFHIGTTRYYIDATGTF